MQAFRANFAVWLTIALKLAKPILAILTKALTIVTKLFKGAGATKLAFGAASFGAYAVLTDWRFGVAVLACIGIHESGHVWAMRRMGMQTRGFYFIPLLGGVAVQESAFPSAWAEGYVALMGPIWGLFVTAVTYVLYLTTGNVVFEVAACWMAFVNVVNLVPVFPLDGGRVVRSLAQSVRSVGATVVTLGVSAAGIAACVFAGYWLFAWFGVIGIMEELGNRRKRRDAGLTWKDHRALFDAHIASLARMLGLPVGASWDEVHRAVLRFRKDPAWRADIERITMLRGAYTHWLRSWEALRKRWVKRYNVRLEREAYIHLRSPDPGATFQALLAGLLEHRGWHSNYLHRDADGVVLGRPLVGPLPDAEAQRIRACVLEFWNLIEQAQETCGRTWDRIRKHGHAVGVAPEATDIINVRSDEDLDVAMRTAGVGLWYLSVMPFGERRVEIALRRVDPHVPCGGEREWWLSSPSFMLLLLATDGRARGTFSEQYGYSRCDEEWMMPPKRLAAIIGTTVVLAVTLFMLMTGTGGHEAATHAVEFFQKL